jgi:8-oxo-dGTP pyrophosphatase MutT (NUDIX family)
MAPSVVQKAVPGTTFERSAIIAADSSTPVRRQVRRHVRRVAYQAFGKLPPRVRRGVVGVVAPSFTVGALAVLHDGAEILFVTQLHRPGLSLPGGLLKKGEAARSALARELAEELGLPGLPFADAPDTAHVDPGKTRVDLVFFAAVDRTAVAPVPGSEVLAFHWRTAQDPELTPQTQEILAAIAGRLPG